MKKFAIFLISLAVLSVGLYYFYIHWKSKEGELENFATWKEFTPRSRLFKVLLPNPPQYAKDEIAIPNSDKTRRYDMYASEKVDGTLFLISVITYPPDADISFSEDILKQNIDELMHNKVDNQLTKLDHRSLQEHKTMEFSIENREFRVEGKAIQDGRMVYMLTYITPKENFDNDEYTHFVESFHILKKDKGSTS